MRSVLAVAAAIIGILLVSVAILVTTLAIVAGRIDQPAVLAPVIFTVALFILLGVFLVRLAGRSLRRARILQIGLGMALVSGIAVLGLLQHLGAFEQSKVKLDNDVLLIQGKLDEELLASFRRVADSHELRNVRVRLRSPGGSIYVGMAIGREIHRRQLDVEVDRRCNSSCANYLFTAGRNKYLKSADQVQFHGGALQPDFVAEAHKHIEQGRHRVTGDDIPQGVDLPRLRKLAGLPEDFPFNPVSAILAEKAFFDEIGVSSLTPVYGQYGDYAAWFRDGIHDNFSYLPEDYARLGVENVIIANPDYAKGFGRNLFRARTSATIISALQDEMASLHQEIEAAMQTDSGGIWRK